MQKIKEILPFSKTIGLLRRMLGWWLRSILQIRLSNWDMTFSNLKPCALLFFLIFFCYTIFHSSRTYYFIPLISEALYPKVWIIQTSFLEFSLSDVWPIKSVTFEWFFFRCTVRDNAQKSRKTQRMEDRFDEW